MTSLLLLRLKMCFVMTDTCLSWQNFCRDKNDTYGSSRQWWFWEKWLLMKIQELSIKFPLVRFYPTFDTMHVLRRLVPVENPKSLFASDLLHNTRCSEKTGSCWHNTWCSKKTGSCWKSQALVRFWFITQYMMFWEDWFLLKILSLCSLLAYILHNSCSEKTGFSCSVLYFAQYISMNSS